jgi:hypothetical protein
MWESCYPIRGGTPSARSPDIGQIQPCSTVEHLRTSKKSGKMLFRLDIIHHPSNLNQRESLLLLIKEIPSTIRTMASGWFSRLQ